MVSKRDSSKDATTSTVKTNYIRIAVPEDDEVVNAFLDGQPSRGRSLAIRSMIHLFVSEHGYVDVLSVTGRSMVGATQQAQTPQSAQSAKNVSKNDAVETVDFAKSVDSADDSDSDNTASAVEVEPQFVEPQPQSSGATNISEMFE